MSIFTGRARPAKMTLGEASSLFAYQWLDNFLIHKYRKFEQNIPCGPRVMSVFTIRARPSKFLVFCILDNVKIHKYRKFERNAPHGSRVMSIFTKRARPAKIMLGEASSLFFLPVAGQCLNILKAKSTFTLFMYIPFLVFVSDI